MRPRAGRGCPSPGARQAAKCRAAVPQSWGDSREVRRYGLGEDLWDKGPVGCSAAPTSSQDRAGYMVVTAPTGDSGSPCSCRGLRQQLGGPAGRPWGPGMDRRGPGPLYGIQLTARIPPSLQQDGHPALLAASSLSSCAEGRGHGHSISAHEGQTRPGNTDLPAGAPPPAWQLPGHQRTQQPGACCLHPWEKGLPFLTSNRRGGSSWSEGGGGRVSLQGRLPPLPLSTQGSQVWCSGSFSTTLLQGPIGVGGGHWLSRTQRPGPPVAPGSGGSA